MFDVRDDNAVRTLLSAVPQTTLKRTNRRGAHFGSSFADQVQAACDDEALGSLLKANGHLTPIQDARDDDAFGMLMGEELCEPSADPLVFLARRAFPSEFAGASSRNSVNNTRAAEFGASTTDYLGRDHRGVHFARQRLHHAPSHQTTLLDKPVPSDDELLDALIDKRDARGLHATFQDDMGKTFRDDNTLGALGGAIEERKVGHERAPGVFGNKLHATEVVSPLEAKQYKNVGGTLTGVDAEDVYANVDHGIVHGGEPVAACPDDVNAVGSAFFDSFASSVPDSIPGLITDQIGVLIQSALMQRHRIDQTRWVFVGPREKWRAVGLSQLSLQALGHLGSVGCPALAEAAQTTDAGTLYPEAVRAVSDGQEPIQDQGLFSSSCRSGRAKNAGGPTDSGAADPAVALLQRAISEWGRGTEGRILDRVARFGGSIVMLMCKNALDRWQLSGVLPEVRGRSRVRLRSDPSGGLGKRMSVRVASFTLVKHIVAALSPDLSLLADVVLASGDVLKRDWQLLPKTSASKVHGISDLLKAKLPLTLWFDTQPGLPVVQSAPLPVVSQPVPSVTASVVRWPPAAGLRVQRADGDDGEDAGTVICSGRKGWALIRWDADDEYEQVHVGDLKEFDDTMEFLARVHKFRFGNSEGDADRPKKARTAGTNSKMHGKITATESKWRLFFAKSSGDTHAQESTHVGNLQVWELVQGDVGHGGEKIACVGHPMSVPTVVLQRCAEIGGDAPAALLVAGPSASDEKTDDWQGGGVVAADPVWMAPQPAAPDCQQFRLGDIVLVDPSVVESDVLDSVSAAGRWRRPPLRPPPLRARVAALSGRKEVGVRLHEGDGGILWVPGAKVYPALVN